MSFDGSTQSQDVAPGASRKNWPLQMGFDRFGMGFEGSFEAFDRYFDWDMNYVYGKIERNDEC